MSEPVSQKPYLLRALYEWCVDNGYTPYISVVVDEATRVPAEYVRNGEIVLNIGPLAANKLKMGNELVEFAARFGGVARELSVPITAIAAIYARENGHGMSFEVERKDKPAWEVAGHPIQKDPAAEPRAPDIAAPPPVRPVSPVPADPPKPTTPGGRPSLKRIK
jgi:stringent starvation protein B